MKRIYTAFLMMLLLAASGYAQDSMGSAEGSADAGTMMMGAAHGPAMMSTGGKVMFTSLDDARALAQVGPTVLFFNADWCSVCRAEMSEIDARLSELGNFTVVVVDYDRNAKLRRKYGVTYQHTYVQIDGGGEELALWSGGGVDGILSNVVRVGM
jgi:thiol-disulfide isomerase/thioredoxin